MAGNRRWSDLPHLCPDSGNAIASGDAKSPQITQVLPRHQFLASVDTIWTQARRHPVMRGWPILVLAMLAVAMVGCGGPSSDSPAGVRLVQAGQDEPRANSGSTRQGEDDEPADPVSADDQAGEVADGEADEVVDDESEQDAADEPFDEADDERESENTQAADGNNEPMEPNPFQRRIKAPDLTGGVAWINTSGPLSLDDLKGKFVLLDFWTYCCINCMHILPELKKLEQRFPNELVVIGVHSAKFETEEDSQNITDAVLRYDIEHPVVNDSRHAIWQDYQVESWPSLRVIDPEGYLVAGDSGEVTFEVLEAFLNRYLPYYRRKGLLDETPLRFDLAAYQATQMPLRFPGKVLADETSDRLFIADSNHHRIVVTRLDGTLVETIGSGGLGMDDGDYATATFKYPQGMALAGETLYVADTENHVLRKVDLRTKRVKTIAGVGQQSRGPWPGIELFQGDPRAPIALPKRFVGPPLKTALNSPWDLWVNGQRLYIAMAGPHQIWSMPLDESEIGPFAGNGREDIVDGPLLPPQPYQTGYSSFAQPSGLASDGTWLFVADSEGSSIRAVPFDPAGEVRTIVGTAHLEAGRLFDFGDIDGPSPRARLQHPLGVVFHDGMVYVADTYNNKIKVIDPEKETSKTLAGTGEPGSSDDPGQFDEPAGISYAKGKLFVADTNNHRIRTIDLEAAGKVATLEISGLAPPIVPERPLAAPSDPNIDAVKLDAVALRPRKDSVMLAVSLTLPDGYKLNKLAPLRYKLSVNGESGPVDRERVGTAVKVEPPTVEFAIPVPLAESSGEDQLLVTVNYYYCQDGNEGLCKAGTAVWSRPVTVAEDGSPDAVPLEWTAR